MTCGCSKHSKQPSLPCGSWSELEPMLEARTNFAGASGPAQDASNALNIDSDPRVYVFGGQGLGGGALDSGELYNPNTNQWTPLPPLPQPLANCSGAFVPDYGTLNSQLGYIYVAGGGTDQLYQFNIKTQQWQQSQLPAAVTSASVLYLDDVGGPLAQLFLDVSDIELPPCTDSQSLWIVGGVGSEQTVWYHELGQDGLLKGEWYQGPNLPLKRSKPLVGRTFWRDAGITSFGITNCASVIVAGGEDMSGKSTKDVQLLVRKNCQWRWIHACDNPTDIPSSALKLAVPVSDGGFGTEQWPETLVTGGRPILFGGLPPSAESSDSGSTQYAQFRFVRGRLERDAEAPPANSQSDWSLSTPMPGLRIGFRAMPLSQDNSSQFGGRRISRFLVVGGSRTDGEELNRVQLFELPVPTIKSLRISERNSHKSKCCC